MATRQRKVNLVQPPSGDTASAGQPADEVRSVLDADRPSPMIAGEQDSLMDMLAGFTDATSVTVKVYRVVKNRPLAYVYECSPETFSMDSLRDDYGGGEFRVYIHRDGTLYKNVRVMVEPPRKVERPASELDSALAGIRERQEKTDKILEALAARVMAPPPPPQGIGSILGNMDNLPQVIAAVGSLLQIIRPPAPVIQPPPPPPDPMAGIEVFMKALEVAKELKGDGNGGESSLMDVVRDLIKSPFLSQAVQAATAADPTPRQLPAPPMVRRPNPGQPMPARPVPTPMGTVMQPAPEVSHAKLEPTPQQSENSPMHAPEELNAAVMQQMAFLCTQAAHNADPELYAGLILDQLDDDTILGILDWKPDPVSAIIEQYPPAAPHREWFQQVLEFVALAFDEGEGGEDSVDVIESGQTPNAGPGDATGPDTPVIPGGTP